MFVCVYIYKLVMIMNNNNKKNIRFFLDIGSVTSPMGKGIYIYNINIYKKSSKKGREDVECFFLNNEIKEENFRVKKKILKK